MSKKKAKGVELIDWYATIPKKFLNSSHNPNYHLHGLKIPFRMLITGNSGSGKTSTLLNIIHNMGNTFEQIFIICKSKDEPLYRYLEDKLGDSGLSIVEGIANAPDIEKDLSPDVQSLVVMDDLVGEKNQTILEEYFIRARKRGASLIYLTQSYYRTPRMIRQNLTYMIIKKVSSLKDLYRILSEYTLGVDKEVLKRIYEDATADKKDFLLIDLDAPDEGKFRKNFTDIYETS